MSKRERTNGKHHKMEDLVLQKGFNTKICHRTMEETQIRTEFWKKRTEQRIKQRKIQDFVSAINETVLADSEDLETRA